MLYRVLCHECRRLATYCADKEIARQLSLLSDTLCERCTAKKERSRRRNFQKAQMQLIRS